MKGFPHSEKPFFSLSIHRSTPPVGVAPRRGVSGKSEKEPTLSMMIRHAEWMMSEGCRHLSRCRLIRSSCTIMSNGHEKNAETEGEN